jgi:hypothetical protein
LWNDGSQNFATGSFLSEMNPYEITGIIGYDKRVVWYAVTKVSEEQAAHIFRVKDPIHALTSYFSTIHSVELYLHSAIRLHGMVLK